MESPQEKGSNRERGKNKRQQQEAIQDLAVLHVLFDSDMRETIKKKTNI